MTGPLADLRVVDLTDNLGRFASKLLAEAGASVVRVAGRGAPGAPMTNPEAASLGGVLDWWYDGGMARVELDLDTPGGADAYRRLAGAADLVIESEAPGRLEQLGLDHRHLVEANPRLVQVSLTPFGRTGPWSNWAGSDLVAGALGGVLSITGLPDEPLNSYGGQNHHFGGFMAAISGLAGVRAARRDGHGQLLDLSLHEVVTGSIENLLMQYLYDDVLPMPKVAERQGSLHWLRVYQVAPARSGYVMITPTPGAEPLVDWMVESGIESAQPFVGLPVVDLLARADELMAAMREFLLTDDAGTLWTEAQARHIAFGEVQSVAQAADNPQYSFRELYRTVPLASTGGEPAGEVRLPARLVRYSASPIGQPRPPRPDPVDLDEILTAWPPRPAPGPTPDPAPGETPKPLDGVRVLDLSWVLAGPFATRILGDLGADVVKVQHEARATLVNLPDYPYYAVWNRSKRSATIDLKHPEALAVIRSLVEASDVLVENYSSGVLSRLGLGWEDVLEWNPRLVYVSMSGPGHEGPWKDVISYAPTIHALCGLTHLTNPEGRGDVGCGFSLNDHAAGFASAFSILAALEHVERTGVGQYVDMAQLEIGTYLLGPAMIDYFNNGREAQPMGNRDGLADLVPNDVYPTVDGFVAVTANHDAMWRSLADIIGADSSWDIETRRTERAEIDRLIRTWAASRSAVDAASELQEHGVAAGQVQTSDDLVRRDPQHQARQFFRSAEHPVFGERLHDRFPGLWSASGDLSPYQLSPAYLGEANFEVWGELVGLDAGEVAEGIASGLFT